MLPALREGIDSPATTGPLVLRDPGLRPETHFPVNVVAWKMLSSSTMRNRGRKTHMSTQKVTRTIFEAAILGFELQRERLAEQIAELRVMLDGRPAESSAATPEVPKRRRRKMSAAGRKAIAEAQKARSWVRWQTAR